MMNSHKYSKDRLITAGIVTLSVLGIIYFGFQAFLGNSQKEEPNPFEYNIEHFKKNAESLNHYTEIKQISTKMQNLYALALDSADQLYVAGDQTCVIFDQNWQRKSFFDLPGRTSALVLDQNNDIYCASMDHVLVFDHTGNQQKEWAAFNNKSILTSIDLTEEHVFLADAGNLVVLQYDKSGKLIRQIGKKDKEKEIPGFIIPSPYFDVAVDPDGFLWAANTGRQSLENYTMEGDLRTQWGEPGMDVEGFCGCCNPSHFTLLEDGSFITAEKGIARVKVYNRIGELTSVVAGPDEFDEGTVGLDLAVDSKNRIFVLDPKRGQVRIFKKTKMQF
jgi:hypothetical protein